MAVVSESRARERAKRQADIKGVGWSILKLKGGDNVSIEGKRAPPPHDDHVKRILGEPRSGESALDQRALPIDLVGKPERFKIDWSKMSATKNPSWTRLGGASHDRLGSGTVNGDEEGEEADG